MGPAPQFGSYFLLWSLLRPIIIPDVPQSREPQMNRTPRICAFVTERQVGGVYFQHPWIKDRQKKGSVWCLCVTQKLVLIGVGSDCCRVFLSVRRWSLTDSCSGVARVPLTTTSQRRPSFFLTCLCTETSQREWSTRPFMC